MQDFDVLIVTIAPETILKSDYVKKKMQRKLLENISFYLKNKKIKYKARIMQNRIFISTEEVDEAEKILEKCFGVYSLMKAKKIEFDSLEDLGKKVSENFKNQGNNFAIRAKSYSNDFSSKDVEIECGSTVLKKYPSLKVNLDSPEKTIRLFCFEKEGFQYYEIIKGPSGLPVGSQGNAIVCSNNEQTAKKIALFLLKKGVSIILFGDFSLKEIEQFNCFKEFSSIDKTKAKTLILGQKSPPILSSYKKDFFGKKTIFVDDGFF